MLAICAFFVGKALLKGFLRELGTLLGLFLAIVGGFALYQPVAQFLRRVVGLANFWWEAASFVLCFIVIYVVIMFIAGRVAKVLHRTSLSFIDRVLGGALGLLKGVIICYLLVNVLLMIQPFSTFFSNDEERLKGGWVTNSYLAPTVVQAGHFMLSFIPDDFVASLQDKAGLLKEQTVMPEQSSCGPAPTSVSLQQQAPAPARSPASLQPSEQAAE